MLAAQEGVRVRPEREPAHPEVGLAVRIRCRSLLPGSRPRWRGSRVDLPSEEEASKDPEQKAEGVHADLLWKAGSGLARGDRRGHFFCATVGERIYLRFVPLDGADEDIVAELGTCLRLIECVEDTPRVLLQDLAETAFEAWGRARRSVYDAWAFETDPANLQPRLRPLNTQVADHLRAYPPPGIEDKELEKVLESVESPWSRREENLLRLIYNDEDKMGAEKSLALVEEIRRIGLESFEAPAPLPPIEPDDIHLICWMAIEAESGDA